MSAHNCWRTRVPKEIGIVENRNAALIQYPMQEQQSSIFEDAYIITRQKFLAQ